MAATLPPQFSDDDLGTDAGPGDEAGGHTPQFRGGGAYRTPQRSQLRYIDLLTEGRSDRPGMVGGPEPLVLFDYGSPATMTERLEMALAQQFHPGRSGRLASGPALQMQERAVMHSATVKEEWPAGPRDSDRRRSAPGEGPVATGRAVAVVKGPNMAYLAAHVLCHASRSPRQHEALRKLKPDEEMTHTISLVYDNQEQVREVQVKALPSAPQSQTVLQPRQPSAQGNEWRSVEAREQIRCKHF